MWHVGIDLHRATVVMAAVNDAGESHETDHHSLRQTRKPSWRP